MTLAGWFLMLVSCGTVTAVMLFCYWRLLRDDDGSHHGDLSRADSRAPRGQGPGVGDQGR